jgi:hypothetical protein
VRICLRSVMITFPFSIDTHTASLNLRFSQWQLDCDTVWSCRSLPNRLASRDNVCESSCEVPNPWALSPRHGGTGSHFHTELVPTHVQRAEKMGYKMFPWRPASTLPHTLPQDPTIPLDLLLNTQHSLSNPLNRGEDVLIACSSLHRWNALSKFNGKIRQFQHF